MRAKRLRKNGDMMAFLKFRAIHAKFELAAKKMLVSVVATVLRVEKIDSEWAYFE